MKELALPHLAPIRFAKFVISRDGDKAIVRNEFSSIPSLGMFIEAAAQSSAAFADDAQKGQEGFLTLVKNVKLLAEPTSLEYDIAVTLAQKINNSGYLTFEVNQNDEIIATGTLMVTLA